MDNEKILEGVNLTYIAVLRSLPVRTNQHGEKASKKNVSKVLYIRPTKLHIEVTKSNIETSNDKMCYGIQKP
jgi:hypothetical protein